MIVCTFTGRMAKLCTHLSVHMHQKSEMDLVTHHSIPNHVEGLGMRLWGDTESRSPAVLSNSQWLIVFISQQPSNGYYNHPPNPKTWMPDLENP